eukprot:scaffold7204_cov102-Isochrysis_galbana.AAC.7
MGEGRGTDRTAKGQRVSRRDAAKVLGSSQLLLTFDRADSLQHQGRVTCTASRRHWSLDVRYIRHVNFTTLHAAMAMAPTRTRSRSTSSLETT